MNQDQALTRLRAIADEVREYQGTEQMNLVTRLCASLAEIYRHELVSVPVDQLEFRQALAQQMEHLEKFLSGGNEDPRI